MADLSVQRPSVPVDNLLQRRLITGACMMAIFMAAVEGTIVATAMPTIVAELGGFRLFSWVFTAYFLAQAVTTPIYGRLADLFGKDVAQRVTTRAELEVHEDASWDPFAKIHGLAE